jgi:hypothetical protein
MYDKHIANFILKGERQKTLPLKSGNEKTVSTLSTLIQHCSGIPSQRNKTGKRNKGI